MKSRLKITHIITLLLLPFLLGITPAVSSSQAGQVTITFIDVGQGDAIAVRSPEGNVALIDAGDDD